MNNGDYSINYNKSPDGDCAFLCDVVKLPNCDIGDEWLIFGIPPAEVRGHPSTKNDVHEIYFMRDDVEALVAEMKRHKIFCIEAQNAGCSLLTHLDLPCGGKLGIYQPRHAQPESPN